METQVSREWQPNIFLGQTALVPAAFCSPKGDSTGEGGRLPLRKTWGSDCLSVPGWGLGVPSKEEEEDEEEEEERSGGREAMSAWPSPRYGG